MRKRVCVFCGARTGNSKEIISAVKTLCDLLIAEEFDLVYGGGKSGIMGIIANKFMEGNRQVIGIRPEKLIADEDAHHEITKLIIVKDMFERKQQLMNEADIFISLPGGVGTLDELLEVFTHVKIGYISNKYNFVFNFKHYYDSLKELIKTMVKNDFLTEKDAQLLHFINTEKELANRIIELV